MSDERAKGRVCAEHGGSVLGAIRCSEWVLLEGVCDLHEITLARRWWCGDVKQFRDPWYCDPSLHDWSVPPAGHDPAVEDCRYRWVEE